MITFNYDYLQFFALPGRRLPTAKPSMSGMLTSVIKISIRSSAHERIYRVPSTSRSDNLAPEVFQH
jgi:hypothetical protein